jgi:hypothetical protein
MKWRASKESFIYSGSWFRSKSKETKLKFPSENTTDPIVHARNIQQMLGEMVDHLREDIDKVTEPKAQALFETSAEVLIGLRTAFEHYEKGTEKGMRLELKQK